MAMYTPIQVPQPSPGARKVPLEPVAPTPEHLQGAHRMRLGIAVAVIAIVVLLIALF